MFYSKKGGEGDIEGINRHIQSKFLAGLVHNAAGVSDVLSPSDPPLGRIYGCHNISMASPFKVTYFHGKIFKMWMIQSYLRTCTRACWSKISDCVNMSLVLLGEIYSIGEQWFSIFYSRYMYMCVFAVYLIP